MASCAIRDSWAFGSTRTRERSSGSSRDHASRQSALSRFRHHQGGTGRLLRGRRVDHGAAAARPARHQATLSETESLHHSSTSVSTSAIRHIYHMNKDLQSMSFVCNEIEHMPDGQRPGRGDRRTCMARTCSQWIASLAQTCICAHRCQRFVNRDDM